MLRSTEIRISKEPLVKIEGLQLSPVDLPLLRTTLPRLEVAQSNLQRKFQSQAGHLSGKPLSQNGTTKLLPRRKSHQVINSSKMSTYQRSNSHQPRKKVPRAQEELSQTSKSRERSLTKTSQTSRKEGSPLKTSPKSLKTLTKTTYLI